MPMNSSNTRAVVVGIKRFDHFRPLPLAEADAKAFADMLRELGWQDVKLWLGSEADAAGVVNSALAVQDLLHDYFLGPSTSPETFVVFYYARHGYLNVRRDQGYLAFPDTEEKHLTSAIAMDDILQKLVMATSAQRVVAILDCCHSGAAFERFRAAPRDETDLLVGASNVSRLTDLAAERQPGFGIPRHTNRARHVSGRALLAACRANELVPEEEAIVSGVPTGLSEFSYLLCQGWRGAAAVGHKVTIRRLSDWVSDQLQSELHTPILYEPPQPSFVIHELLSTDGSRPLGAVAQVDSPYLADRQFTAWSVGSLRYLLPPFVAIPNEGPFVMGSAQEDVAEYSKVAEYSNEFSTQSGNTHDPVRVEDFEIAVYPVTVAEYALFLAAQSADQRNPHVPCEHMPPDWDTQRDQYEMPVTNITLQDALAYCRWLSSVSRQSYALCSEAQWEKAARWDPSSKHARVFTFGDVWDPHACNVCSARLLRIGEPPTDVSPYGIHDMAGNVMEWTASPLRNYPFNTAPPVGEDPTLRQAVRGASFQDDSVGDARAARRRSLPSDGRYDDVGFRVVRLSTSDSERESRGDYQ